MGGHSTGRHAGEWDGSPADDQASTSHIQGDAGFDQWLGHLTYRWPDDPAGPPSSGVRPAGPAPLADPGISSGAWPPPAFPEPRTDAAPAFPEAGNHIPPGAWPAASPEAGSDVLAGAWPPPVFPDAGNDVPPAAWPLGAPVPGDGVASAFSEAGGDARSGAWPLAAPVAADDEASTAWTSAFSDSGSDARSGAWPLGAPVAGERVASAFSEAGSDARSGAWPLAATEDGDSVPPGAWPLAAPEAGNDVASAAWVSAFAEPGNEEPGKDGGGRRGFLGSGWHDEEPEPRPRRFRRLAILSTVTVLLAAGVTFAGIRLVGGETALTIEPPVSGCASTNSCAAAPAMDAITPTIVPTDSLTDPAIDPGVSPSTTPTKTPEAAEPTPTAVSPTPVPKTKKTPAATPSKKPPATVDDEPTQDTDSVGEIEDPGTATDEETPDQRDIRVAEIPQVALGFEVLRQDDIGYTARIVVRNEGADLSGWTFELPVGGQVTAVDSGQWEQRGGILVITPDAALAAGDELVITFDGDGTAEQPSECTLSEGECRLSTV